MKIYKTAQSSSIVYYGHNDPNDHATQEEGVFLTPDPNMAKQHGEYVDAIQIKPGKYYYPDTFGHIRQNDINLIKEFIRETIREKNVNYRVILRQMLFHPTSEWLMFLRRKGYNGFINGNYVFVADIKDTRYLGEYDFDQRSIRQPELKMANKIH